MPSEVFRLEADGILRCLQFLDFSWISHGFGTRAASPSADVTLRQVHSSIVRNVAGLSDRQEEGDALVSDLTGLSIGIRTADCVPLLLLDPQRRAVAAIHAGWRGTVARIARHTINRMRKDFHCNPHDIHAAIGPCIRECCYEVSADVAGQFTALFPEWQPLQGKRKIDLAEANRRQLLLDGVAAEHIFDAHLCTACSVDQLFSYRCEPDNPGRMTSAIRRLH